MRRDILLAEHDNGYQLRDRGDCFEVKHKDSAAIRATYYKHNVAVQRFEIYKNQPVPKIENVRAR